MDETASWTDRVVEATESSVGGSPIGVYGLNDPTPFVVNDGFCEHMLSVCDVVRSVLVVRKTWSSAHLVRSYGLKHVAEKAIGSYVANGEAILAVAILGIPQRPMSSSPNSLIRATYTDTGR